MTQCSNEEFGRLIVHYELGWLSDEERDRFEEHLMDCDACLQELEQMRPIIGALRRDRAEILDELHRDGISFETLKGELRSRSPVNRSVFGKVMQVAVQALSNLRQARVLIPAVALISALVLVRIYYLPHYLTTAKPEIPKTVPATRPDGEIPAGGSAPMEVYGHLGSYGFILAFETLPYQPMKLRGTTGDAERSFDEGMEYYLRGNYRDAISNLNKAVEKTPENGAWWLYLGVCHYLERDAKAAIKALTRADSLTQYSNKTRARWYLAQAHLLNDDANQAIPLLQWLIDQRKTYADKADSLLTGVRSIQTLEQGMATPK